MTDKCVVGNKNERRHKPRKEEGDPEYFVCPLFGLGISCRGNDNPRQRRATHCYNHQRRKQELTLFQDGIKGEPQPPGDREGDEEEGCNLIVFDPIGELIHDISCWN